MRSSKMPSLSVSRLGFQSDERKRRKRRVSYEIDDRERRERVRPLKEERSLPFSHLPMI